MELVHAGDVLAVPFFLILFLYFYLKNKKSQLEIVLMLFALAGLIFDTYVTIKHTMI